MQVREAMADTACAAMAAVQQGAHADVHVDVCLKSSVAFLRQRCWWLPALQQQLMHWIYR